MSVFHFCAIVSFQMTACLFIAPLHLLNKDDIDNLLNSTSVVDVQYSRNRNAMTVEFDTMESAKVVRQFIQSEYPGIVVGEGKIKRNKPQTVEIPIPATPEEIAHQLPGLIVIPDWVSAEEEALIMEEIDSGTWDTTIKRRVQHFGFRFEYSRLDVDKSVSPSAFPSHCQSLVERSQLAGYDFNQLTINEYLAGVGIASHCDTHSAFTNCIGVVSLMADITIDFISHDSLRKVHAYIPRRSLYLMTGESRYGWRHGISARKCDRNPLTGEVSERLRRVSLTFRNCTKNECDCQYPSLCDTQGADVVRPRRMQNG